ncbi:MAG TPA: DUF2225 domain-containing protein, partial [Bacillota bacterium]|nr:DUF2225 domain-containing protein [Bacillota bacterium]
IRSAQIFQAKASYLGSLFLKAAWCCRFAGQRDSELEFMFEAAKYYQHVFEHETKDLKMSEARLLYLIGEMYRRSRKYNDAVKWFSLAVSNPGIKREPEIERLARDQWLQTKADLKEAQELAEQNGEEFVLEQTVTSSSDDSEVTVSEAEVAVANAKVLRTTVSMYTQIYQDQYEWLRTLSNRAHSEHQKVLEKNEIVRAALDAVLGVEVPSEHLETEETLTNFFKTLINGEE